MALKERVPETVKFLNGDLREDGTTCRVPRLLGAPWSLTRRSCNSESQLLLLLAAILLTTHGGPIIIAIIIMRCFFNNLY